MRWGEGQRERKGEGAREGEGKEKRKEGGRESESIYVCGNSNNNGRKEIFI